MLGIYPAIIYAVLLMKQNMKLLLITDAWSPQTNGVVTTLKTAVVKGMQQKGLEVEVIHPDLFHTIPIPFYPEIELALFPRKKIKTILETFKPDYVHIATEGPLGVSAKRFLDKFGWKYTTSLHTKFPEYVNERCKLIKVSWGYSLLKWFHKHATNIFVTTPSMKKELVAHGFDDKRMVVWGRGVDTVKLTPDPKKKANGKKPTLMYVGRLAVEKNINAFLDAEVDGRKVLVGDGPQAEELKQQYPEVEFWGYKYGEELVASYQQADVFVFPSKTDTFGLVMLEALACGTPVAAYPVAGPVDVIENGKTGVLHEDLTTAIKGALKINRADCRKFAEQQSWGAVTDRLFNKLAPNKHLQ